MDINNLEYSAGPSSFYDQSFMAVLEDHMTNLRADPLTQEMELDGHRVYQWVGDLYGLLRTMSIPPYMFWVIMRMNGMDSPTDLNENYTALLVPSGTVLKRILNQHKTLAKTTL